MRAAEEDDWDRADRYGSAGVSTGYLMRVHAPRTRRYSNVFPGQMQRSPDAVPDRY